MNDFDTRMKLADLKGQVYGAFFTAAVAFLLVAVFGLATLRKIDAITDRIERLEQVADSTAIER